VSAARQGISGGNGIIKSTHGDGGAKAQKKKKERNEEKGE
jgi:hypothetical protein